MGELGAVRDKEKQGEQGAYLQMKGWSSHSELLLVPSLLPWEERVGGVPRTGCGLGLPRPEGAG